MKNKKKLTRSEIMSRVRSKNTKPELSLRKSLYKLGMRYRVNAKDIVGKPDIYIRKYKLAIFVDSDFWHGRLYLQGKRIPKTNKEYWISKLEKNIRRDKYVTNTLKADGWLVLRYWKSDINQNIDKVTSEIIGVYKRFKELK
ncbi:very short patch repair endonuclease [Sulfurimonas sp.]